MKKTYEKPVLTTEQFDVDDVITASSPAEQPQGQPDTVGNTWQVPGLNLND